MKKRLAIIDGIRTPFCHANGKLKDLQADDLGAIAIKELLLRTSFPEKEIDEVIVGNVCQPVHAANVARITALKAGLPTDLIAHTVHRNCASGMQSITAGANKILAGEAEVILAGGIESMSNVPLLFGRKMTDFFMHLFKAKTPIQKLQTVLSFRMHFLKPIIGLEVGLSDPICGMNMGQTAEVLSREFHVSRDEQDEYALMSHQRAVAATKDGKLDEEIVPVPIPPKYKSVQEIDDGPRPQQTMEQLQKLRPYFNRKTGTVTVGNACSITDGAAMVILTTEEKAKKLGYEPLGYLTDYTYAALDGSRMGLGPVYSTAKLLKKTGMKMSDFKLVELNEAFAAQVIANEKAFSSKEFAERHLGQASPVGELSRDILNVNGGAIALGHPVGTTGTRLVLTLLKEMRRRNEQVGLATLCIGGGQGAALALEVA
ncbi:acetyl-CoA acyltransferase [bacterium B17]|nr:acetyl-CoA acyltransferase [bacterium B17]